MAFKGLILTRLQLRDASACDFKSKGVSPAPSCRFTVMLKKKKNEEKKLSCIGMVRARGGGSWREVPEVDEEINGG